MSDEWGDEDDESFMALLPDEGAVTKHHQSSTVSTLSAKLNKFAAPAPSQGADGPIQSAAKVKSIFSIGDTQDDGDKELAVTSKAAAAGTGQFGGQRGDSGKVSNSVVVSSTQNEQTSDDPRVASRCIPSGIPPPPPPSSLSPIGSPRAKAPRLDDKGSSSDSEVEEWPDQIVAAAATLAGPIASSASSSKRRFPGPAGLLPRLHLGLDSQPQLASLLARHHGPANRLSLDDKHLPGPAVHPDAESAGLEELTEGNRVWQKMLSDDAVPNRLELMEQFNVKHVVDRVGAATGVGAKTPFLVAALKSVDLSSGPDPTCQLVDHTGSIRGILHGEIVEDHGSRIHPGSVLVLRDLAVLATIRSTYVNITPNNLVSLYWADPSRDDHPVAPSGGVFAKHACRITSEDVLRSAKAIEADARMAREAAAAAVAAAKAALLREVRGCDDGLSSSSSNVSLPSSIMPPNRFPGPPPRPCPGTVVGQAGSFRPRFSSSPSQAFRGPPTSRPPYQPVRAPAPLPRAAAASCQRPTRPPPPPRPQSIISDVPTPSGADLLEGLDEESLFGDF